MLFKIHTLYNLYIWDAFNENHYSNKCVQDETHIGHYFSIIYWHRQLCIFSCYLHKKISNSLNVENCHEIGRHCSGPTKFGNLWSRHFSKGTKSQKCAVDFSISSWWCWSSQVNTYPHFDHIFSDFLDVIILKILIIQAGYWGYNWNSGENIFCHMICNIFPSCRDNRNPGRRNPLCWLWPPVFLSFQEYR